MSESRASAHEAAHSLADHLRDKGILRSVGIGGAPDAPVLYAYVSRKIALSEWAGYPVEVRRMGKIVAAQAA